MGVFTKVSEFMERTFADEPIDVDTLFATHRPAQLSEFLPYRYYDEDKELYINDDGYGFTLEIIPLMGVTQQRLDVLKGAFSLAVPDDVSVQIMQINSPKTGSVLKMWGEARAGSSEAHTMMMRKRLQHLGRGSFNSLSKLSNFHLRYHRVVVSVSMKGLDNPEQELQLIEYKANLSAALRQCAGYVVEVKPEQLVRMLSDILNPTHSIQPSRKEYDPSVELNKQLIERDTSYLIYRDKIVTTSIREADQSLGEDPIEDNFTEDVMETRCLEVKNFPRHVRFGDMSHLLGDFFTNEIRFSSPTVTVLNVQFPKEEAAKVGAEQKSMNARRVAEGPSGRYMVSMRNRGDDWDKTQQAIVDGARPVKVSMFCLVTAKKGNGRTAERNARNVFQSARYEMRRTDQVHLPTFLAALPMCADARIGRDVHVMGRSRTAASNMIVPTAPMFGEFMGTSDPCMLFIGRLGQPFFWSPFSSKGEGNMNGTCIGASGSGKSFWMTELMVCHTAIGGHTIIVDDGYSFMQPCNLLGGTHYTFSIKDEFCLNAFDMIDPSQIALDDDYLGERLETCKAIYAQMTLGDLKPTPEENGILMSAVTAVWHEHGREGQTDHVHAFLEAYDTESKSANTKAMANAMLPYCSSGTYGTIFNGKNTLDLSNRLTVFELSPLEQKKDLRGIIVTALFALIDSKVTTDRKREDLIILDEAWKLLGSETIAATLEGWARRLRKYGAGLMLGTQSITDFSNNSGARAVFENSEWTVILKSKNAAIQPMSELDLFPDKYALRCAKDLKVSPGEYAESLIICENWYAVGRLCVDSFTQTLYSTTADEVAMLNDLRADGMGLEEAVNEMAQRKERMALAGVR